METLALEFLTNTFGYIKDDYKQKIMSYLQCPTYSGWSDISGIIVQGRMKTIWQMVLEVDSTFPRVGRRYGEQMEVKREWERIPERETLIKALKHAATKNTGIKF
jgi:hypothetical protein